VAVDHERSFQLSAVSLQLLKNLVHNPSSRRLQPAFISTDLGEPRKSHQYCHSEGTKRPKNLKKRYSSPPMAAQNDKREICRILIWVLKAQAKACGYQ
jgi:hypothetical protein